MSGLTEDDKTPVHPGQILKDELDSIGVTPTELARQIKVSANRMSLIVRGKRAITADTALRLAHWFSMNPLFWMNLQKGYELEIAAAALGKRINEIPRFARGAE